jgi:hypothetical protein
MKSSALQDVAKLHVQGVLAKHSLCALSVPRLDSLLRLRACALFDALSALATRIARDSIKYLRVYDCEFVCLLVSLAERVSLFIETVVDAHISHASSPNGDRTVVSHRIVTVV